MTRDLPAWQAARRVLAIRLDNLGDVLMTTPALRALKSQVPGRHITLLASQSGAAAVPFVPEIDNVIVAAPPWMPASPARPAAVRELVDTLAAERFDAAVVFTVYSQNPLPAAMLCWQAGIPLILAHCRENPYHLVTDWVPESEPHEQVRHEVRRQLDLVAAVGATTDDERLSFRLRPEDTRTALDKLRRAGIDPSRRWAVVHPGATAASRRWPAGHFAELAARLGESPDLQLVFTGTAAEAPLIDAIRDGLDAPQASLAGQLSLGELGAVIAPAALMVANNTGPVHIAAALGTPVVDIYALTNPQHAPWQVPHRVLFHDVPCRFCYRSSCPQGHHDCLRRLDPQRVADAAFALLAGAERVPAGIAARSAATALATGD